MPLQIPFHIRNLLVKIIIPHQESFLELDQSIP